MDEDFINEFAGEAKTAWQKLKAAVISAPATFVYGLAIGAILGAIFF